MLLFSQILHQGRLGHVATLESTFNLLFVNIKLPRVLQLGQLDAMRRKQELQPQRCYRPSNLVYV